MSDYNQITNFTAKDSLPAADAEKDILGSDVDAELSAISTAIASKVDEPSSPTTNDILYWDGSAVAWKAEAANDIAVLAHGVSLPYTGTEMKLVTGFADTYDYQIQFENIAVSATNKNLFLYFFTDGGTTPLSGVIQWGGWGWEKVENADGTYEQGEDQDYVVAERSTNEFLDPSGGTHYPVFVELRLINPTSADETYFMLKSIIRQDAVGGGVTTYEYSGYIAAGNAINAISWKDSAGGSITCQRIVMRRYTRS